MTTTIAIFDGADGCLRAFGETPERDIMRAISVGWIVCIVPIAEIKQCELFECLSIEEINGMRHRAMELVARQS